MGRLGCLSRLRLAWTFPLCRPPSSIHPDIRHWSVHRVPSYLKWPPLCAPARVDMAVSGPTATRIWWRFH
ncbi:hypothetical protein HBI56_223480 [Parastagonospora nodorum]|nr:hypothetical protein HBH52_065070 [Parastagonospora nodorum]KAH4053915.1 hypothetical protein HBH49_073360 [Parastagonospora nodorum]KAH4192393.1 hypothetical protein HBH42_106370 [Parastagonospora nodorum]KAH4210436.1 hypothetical protein HBI95_059500 [Parastagonospora nodorum]KAH4216183.1 hypothetical protein HBI06_234980 [Parastagonospora nodorum]